MYIDTHAHIQDEILKNKIDKVIFDAQQNNVKKIVCASYDLKSSFDAVQLCKQYKNVYAVIGVHPENCEEYSDKVEEELLGLSKEKKVVAIGEIGLDYHYSKENKEIQKEVFIKQILLADKLKLPVVIHTRDAIGDTMDIVRKYENYLKNGVVFHCFNASEEILNEIVGKGFYVSYGGVVTFNNAKNLVEIVKKTP